MIKNIIFDWSGTLHCDFLHVYKATAMAFYELRGKSISLNEFSREFKLPFLEFWHKYFPRMTLAEEVDVFLRAWDRLKPPEPFPEAGIVLEVLQEAGINMAILSSHNRERLISEVKAGGLGKYFGAISGSVHNKVEAIGGILLKNGFYSDTTMIVGDMVHDIEAGKAAGIKTVALYWAGYYPYLYDKIDRLAASFPDYIITDLVQLVRIVMRANYC